MLDAAANVSLARPLLLLLLHSHFNQNVWQQTPAAQCAKAPRNNNPHQLARLISLFLSQSIPLPKKKDMPDLMKKKKPTRTVLDTKTLKKQGRQQRQQQLQRVVHDTLFVQFTTFCDSFEH